MSRDIKKVRKAIEERKKKRRLPQEVIHQSDDLFLSPEEKHGFPPTINDYHFNEKQRDDWVSLLLFKGIMASILFFSVALVLSLSHPLLQKPKEVTHRLLQEEFPFAKINVWYQDVFGSPLAFVPHPNERVPTVQEAVLPVNGDIIETFQMNGTGVKISPGIETDVVAHDEGVVVFAGKYPDTGQTIIVQHADGTNSHYGHLSTIDVHLYQYVSMNQRIGQFTPTATDEAVYFSLEKDNVFLDPVKVIEVDDRP